MFDLDKWQEIYYSISRHLLRTIITMFGVGWGIFVLVFLMGAGTGLKNGVNKEFRDDAVNSIWLWRGVTSEPYNGLPSGRFITFDNSDYEYLREEFKDIDEITGRFYLTGDQTVSYKNKSFAYSVRAVHPGHKVLENTIIEKGRYINEADVDNFTKIAIIGLTVEQNLFEEESAIAKEINIGGIVYKVVGVFSDTGGEREMRNIYIPVTTAQKVYDGSQRLHQLMFTGGDLSVEEMEVLEDKVRASFAVRKQFDVNDRRAIGIFNLAKEYQSFMSLFAAINFIILIVGIFSIIAGVIGVSNIMLIIVKDRTKEIGIRKAMGATPGSIISMIMMEAILITSIAGYLGLVGGVGFIALIAQFVEGDFFLNPQVDFSIAIKAVIILVISGALAGLIPALKAARINPVIAMKND